MMDRFCLRAAILMLPLLLGACATVTESGSAISQDVSAPARQFQPALEVDGRLSIRYQGPGGEEALHGSFQWHQDGPQTRVTFLSPLGQAVARIQTTPNGASLAQPGQPSRTADDVDTLTANALGWPLPVAGLRQWLQGFAIDAQGNRFVATPPSNTVTTRDGWYIQYPTWQDDQTGTPRPRRIDLSRRTAQAGDVAIRIVIDTWQPL